MTLENIKEVLNLYSQVKNLALEKVKIMKRCDSKYYDTRRGITRVDYIDEQVVVTYDATFRGHYCTDWFAFPLRYLTLNDDELRIQIEVEKQQREFKEQQEEQERKKKEVAEKEKREIQMLIELKEKYKDRVGV